MWNRSLNVYVEHPFRGRLRLEKAYGKYWKVVIGVYGVKHYVTSIPEYMVDADVGEVVRYIENKLGVKFDYVVGKRSAKQGYENPYYLKPKMILDRVDVHVKSKNKWFENVDVWLQRRSKKRNYWSVALKRGYSIKYAKPVTRKKAGELFQMEDYSKILDFLKSNYSWIVRPHASYQEPNERLEQIKTVGSGEDLMRLKWNYIEVGDIEGLDWLYANHPELFSEEEVAAYRLGDYVQRVEREEREKYLKQLEREEEERKRRKREEEERRRREEEEERRREEERQREWEQWQWEEGYPF